MTAPAGKGGGLPDILEHAIAAYLDKVHTVLVGRVEVYDFATRSASIKPMVKEKVNGTSQALPVISRVTVGFPMGGSASLHFPVAKGDQGLLFISERSVEEWKANGREVAPADGRAFHLTDAFFLPWFRPFSEGGAEDASGLVLRLGEARLRMEDGKVALGNDQAELLDTLDDLLGRLITTTVDTPIGIYPISTALNGQIAAVRAQLTLIRGTL